MATIKLKLKEPLHMRDGLYSYAKRVAYKVKDVPKPGPVATEAGHSPVPPELHIPHAVVDTEMPPLTAPPQLPTSSVSNINNSITVRAPEPKRDRVKKEIEKPFPNVDSVKLGKHTSCAECMQAKSIYSTLCLFQMAFRQK